MLFVGFGIGSFLFGEALRLGFGVAFTLFSSAQLIAAVAGILAFRMEVPPVAHARPMKSVEQR
jgi:hypothetical protein